MKARTTETHTQKRNPSREKSHTNERTLLNSYHRISQAEMFMF